MTKLYYKRIIAGLMTIDQVPSLWNAKVRAMLEENGYIINEDGTVSKAEDTE